MKRIFPLLLVLVLSFGAIRPLLETGFFPIHDQTQVIRVGQMASALREGQFPVRWVKDLGYGYGYPIFNFYAPLAYYVGAIFNLVGLDTLLATKLMMILGVLLSAVFIYLLALEFWGEMGGLISALFYVYAPYHALDIYVRGAVGEYWAMAFLPLVFYGLVKGSVIVSALGLAAVILSHNLTVLMIIPFLILAGLALFFSSKNKKKFIIHNSKFIILSLGLSAFYWLPSLAEMGQTKIFGQIGGGADFRDHFVYLDQLWISDWGFGGSSPGRLDGMSFMIGKWHLLVALFGLLAGLLKKKKIVVLAFFSLMMAVFLTNAVSQPLWETLPALAFIQYPWRFLLFAAASCSFLVGAVILWWQEKRWSFSATVAIVLLLLVFNLKYFRAQNIFQTTAADYNKEENIKWFTSRISDEYLTRDFPIPQNPNEVAWEKVKILSGKVQIINLVNQSHLLTFTAQVQEQGEILINTAYFPGWRFLVNGEEKDFTLDGDKFRFSLDPGEHQISLRLLDTPVRLLGNLVSLISWLGVVVFMLKFRYERD